jgi:hypothetical protein
MEHRRVREILESLVQGVDPEKGAPLPSDSVLQSASVLRALLAGIAALEDAERRAARRARLPENVGRSWGESELAVLRGEFECGMTLEQIASAHRRSVKAITARLEKMGVLARTDGWNRVSGVSRSANASACAAREAGAPASTDRSGG